MLMKIIFIPIYNLLRPFFYTMLLTCKSFTGSISITYSIVCYNSPQLLISRLLFHLYQKELTLADLLLYYQHKALYLSRWNRLLFLISISIIYIFTEFILYHVLVMFAYRLNKTEPATFSVLLCWAFFKRFIFSVLC